MPSLCRCGLMLGNMETVSRRFSLGCVSHHDCYRCYTAFVCRCLKYFIFRQPLLCHWAPFSTCHFQLKVWTLAASAGTQGKCLTCMRAPNRCRHKHTHTSMHACEHAPGALSKEAIQPFETMQSLRGRYLGNVSEGEARSKAARYKETRNRSRSQPNIRGRWRRGTVLPQKKNVCF